MNPTLITRRYPQMAVSFVPRELDEIDTELKGVTDRIVEMIGELSQ